MDKQRVIESFRQFELAFQNARRAEGIVGQNSTDLTYAAVVGIDEGIMRGLANALESEIPELANFAVPLADGQTSKLA